jgi:hypothetical protein
MDRTLLRSRKSNTNCSRISGVIRARTISERLLMKKRPGVECPGEPSRNQRRRSLEGGGSCGSALAREVQDIAGLDVALGCFFDLEGAVGRNAVFHPKADRFSRKAEVLRDVGIAAELLT